VAITEFPCSGAIYLATLGLISAKATFLKGMGYLIIYNLMFVIPLIIILILASNRLVVEHVLTANETNAGKIRLFSALTMITIGLVIWLWFT
jgi:cytochrome c-type biogenesis protein